MAATGPDHHILNDHQTHRSEEEMDDLVFREESAARAEAEALCERLLARGDEDSIAAAAAILGTIDAYATLVNERQSQRERLREMESNLQATHELWGRVPVNVRAEVVHGKRSRAA